MSSKQGIEMKPSSAGDEEQLTAEQSETHVTYELGSLDQDSVDVRSVVPTKNYVSQVMPKSELGDFLQRFTRIAGYTLVSTDTTTTAIASFDPHNLFLTNSYIANKTANYSYIRGTLEVQFVVAAPASGYGLYCVSACPNAMSNTDTTAGTTEDFADMTYPCCAQNVHAFIDVASSTNVTLELPFVFPMDYASIPIVNMWKVYLWCLEPVGSVGQDATLNCGVTVYARFKEDVDMVVPKQQGGKLKAKLEEKRSEFNDRVKGAIGMKASEAASKVAGMAAKAAGAIPFLAPLAGPIATGAAAVSGVLDWLGFTRETAQERPMPVVPRPVSNVANVDVPDTSEVAALFVGNTLSYDPAINAGDSADPCATADLFARWTLVDTYAWTQANAAGATICSIPITPMYGFDFGSGRFVLPVAGYVGYPFTYWRGDMEYLVWIPVSKMHRGSLQFSWIPNSTATGDITNVLFNRIVDVSAGQTLQFSVGYAVNQPCLETRTCTKNWPTIVPIGAIANGMFRIDVVNPLVAPSTTGDTHVFIFARAAPNMHFGVPKSADLRYNPADMTAAPTIRTLKDCVYLQGGALGDDVATHKVFELTPGSGDYPQDEILWGEHFESVRPLLQKFTQLVGLQSSTSSWSTSLHIAHFPAQPSNNQPTSYSPTSTLHLPTFNWAGWYLPLFVGVAGSTRYKVFGNSYGNQYVIGGHNLTYPQGFVQIGTTGSMAYFGEVSPTWTVPNGNAVEFTIPFYGRQKFQCTRFLPKLLGQTGYTSCGIDLIQREFYNVDSTQGSLPTLFQAMGPDARVSTFRFTPSLTYNSTFKNYYRWNQ